MLERIKHVLNWVLMPPYYGIPWVVWIYAVIAVACYPHGGVFSGELTGYDDPVRMTQVLNWVNGASWYDRTIMRVNAPEGFETIWSRLVDIPIAAVVVLAQQFVTQKTAALVASVIVPFVELAIAFAAARYFARPMLGKKNARLIVLFLMFTSILNFKGFSVAGFHPGEASHHSWYIILNMLLFGAAARLVSGVRRGSPAFVMGFVMAILMAIGIEAMPIIGATAIILTLIAWWFKRDDIIVQSQLAYAVSSVCGFLLLPTHWAPTHLFDVTFAQFSILEPILTAFAVLFFGAVRWTNRVNLNRQKCISFFIILSISTLLSIIVIYLFPQILDGPAAALSPAERNLAFREHAEAWPLYRVASGKLDFINLGMPSLIALAAGIYALRTTRSPRRKAMYIAYLGFVITTGGITEFFARFYHHAMTTSCVWLAWLWRRINATLPRNYLFVFTSTAVFIILCPLWMLILPVVERHGSIVSQIVLYPAMLQSVRDPCNTVGFGEYLNQHYSKDTLLNVPGYVSSQFLFQTDLRIDFLNNYPSHDQFIDNQTFFGTQDVAVAKRIALQHKFDLVAVCYHVLQPPLPLRPGEEPTMIERLQAHQPPIWLKEMKTGIDSAYRLYEIDKAALHKNE
jgi:hypothetical protein